MFTRSPHIYVESELPAGMTLVEWRRARATSRPRELARMRRCRAWVRAVAAS